MRPTGDRSSAYDMNFVDISKMFQLTLESWK